MIALENRRFVLGRTRRYTETGFISLHPYGFRTSIIVNSAFSGTAIETRMRPRFNSKLYASRLPCKPWATFGDRAGKPLQQALAARGSSDFLVKTCDLGNVVSVFSAWRWERGRDASGRAIYGSQRAP